MTELQQMGEFPYDEPDQQDIEQAEPEQEEATLSDISPESEPETETNAEGQPKPGNKLQERLDKLTAERYEAKRRADELEAKLKKLESQAQPQALPDDLTPPELPEDTWDTEQMRKYHTDMLAYSRKVAAYEARNALTTTEHERKQQLQHQEQAKVVQGFAQRALKNRISIEQLEAAGTRLVNAGLSQELQMLILEDEAGPQITMHLAKNPELAYELLALPTTKAAIKLATSIKAAAISGKPEVTGAPDPIPESKGGSMREKSDFETRFPSAKFI
jgi:hypothetical protein